MITFMGCDFRMKWYSLMMAVIGIFMCFPKAVRAAEYYHVYNGVKLFRVDKDPLKAQPPKEWHILLFKKEDIQVEPVGGQREGLPPHYWGVISGRSYDEVVRELKANQEFEDRFEEWCKCSWGLKTFFNSFGPVAIYENRSAEPEDYREQVAHLKVKMDAVLTGYGSVRNSLLRRYETGSPHPTLGSTIVDFSRELRVVHERNKDVRRLYKEHVGKHDEKLQLLSKVSRSLIGLELDQRMFSSKLGIKGSTYNNIALTK